MPHPIDFSQLKDLVGELARPAALAELGALAGCLLLAWGIVHAIRGRVMHGDRSIWLGTSDWDGVLLPVLALSLALVARVLLASVVTVAVFRLALPMLISLAVIRLTARVLGASFPNSPAMRVVERSVSWIAWLAVVAWVTGILPWTLDAMDDVHWKIGASQVTLRTLVEGVITAALVMMAALWLSSAIEKRLLRRAGSNLSIRKMFANIVRVLLLFVGLLFALSAVGIDLTALSVLGGALGVGLGLGLQRIASNYVSGFVILAEQVLSIGDTVKVDGFEGRITDIRTRYTLIKSADGRESVVPNEMLVISRVENASMVDSRIGITTSVIVEHGADIASLLPALIEAMGQVPRVIADPAPVAEFAAFRLDGLELNLQFWIADADRGQSNVKSAVNLAVLEALSSSGARLALPQRLLHSDQPVAAG